MLIARNWASCSRGCWPRGQNRRQAGLDVAQRPGAAFAKLAKQFIGGAADRSARKFSSNHLSHGRGLAFHGQPEAADFDAENQPLQRCGREVNQKIGHGDVLPGVEDIVPLAVISHPAPVAVGGFKMMNRIRAAEANDVAGIVESRAEIILLALMNQRSLIAAKLQKQIAAKGMGGADVASGDADLRRIAGGLADGVVLVDVDEGNGYRANAGIVKVGQSLLDHPGAGENSVVVDGKNEGGCGELCALIAAGDVALGGFEAVVIDLGKLAADESGRGIGGTVVKNEDFRGGGLLERRFDSFAKIVSAIFGGDDDGGAGS